jgi:hypothetical protein
MLGKYVRDKLLNRYGVVDHMFTLGGIEYCHIILNSFSVVIRQPFDLEVIY